MKKSNHTQVPQQSGNPARFFAESPFTNKSRNTLLGVILVRRLLLTTVFAVIIIATETIQHWLSGEQFVQESHFWFEILFYGFVLPFAFIVALNKLDRSVKERDRIVQELDQRSELSKVLSNSQAEEELFHTILQYPGRIADNQETFLHVLNPDNNRFELAGIRGKGVRSFDDIAPVLYHKDCPCPKTLGLGKLSPAQESSLINQTILGDATLYCLPLCYRQEPVGILHILMLPGQSLSEQQIVSLNETAPEMALALNNARLQRFTTQQSELAEKFQRQVARDLHDTLGQNLAVIRLKLDQISSYNALEKIEDITLELNRMRDVANEAYDQLRNALDTLQADPTATLSSALMAVANKVAERAGLEIHLDSHGEPVSLEPYIQLQLLYICREALFNIEKHSRAHNVHIVLLWKEDELSLEISDDGVGFRLQEMKDAARLGHYGLVIMNERAESVGGKLTISSTPDAGTQVLLCLPLVAQEQAA